jgi:hypothetical protein
MKKYLVALFIAVFAISGVAQTKSDDKNKDSKVEAKTENALLELANATLKAHGGDSFKNMKSLTIIGSVDVTPSNFPQKIPATFVTIFAGDKYRFELNNPFQPIKQVFDGKETFSNVQGGFELPPVNRLGFPVIQKIGDKDFAVSGLADDKEFKKGFRITSPEGYYTDFYIDKKTGLVKSYNSSYVINGNNVTTSVEIDKMRTVDGVVIPERYAQRFDLGQLTVYADFKAKEIVVNKEIADDIFILK